MPPVVAFVRHTPASTVPFMTEPMSSHEFGRNRQANGDTQSPHVLSSLEQLRELYREPIRLVQNKVKAALDPMSVGFVGRCTFLVISTSHRSGRLDVSPRGGPPGFVRVLKSGAIAIPDLNGNNLIDTLGNIVETGQAGCLLVVPGRDETLRVNGPAHVSVDPALLRSFDDQLRTPKTVIVIEPVEVFVHCAKAFRRGGVWDPATWPDERDATPDGVDILACQFELADGGAELRSGMDAGYTAELAADAPAAT